MLVVQRLNSTEEPEKTCWICYGTDNIPGGWLSPCRCKGTSKFVHSRCLQRWIDEKQKHNFGGSVKCALCGFEYLIVGPNLGILMNTLDVLEKGINKICPYVAAVGLLGSAYWTAVTYGAVTVLQVLGHKEGQNVMEQADPLFLLIGLPAIPMGLVVAKLVPWEECLIRFYRKFASRLWGSWRQSDCTWKATDDVQEDRIPVSYSRLLVGAMIFPTISAFVGKLLFTSVKSNLQRTLMGGCVYFSIKGLLKMYYMEMNYKRRSQRRVHNCPEIENGHQNTGN